MEQLFARQYPSSGWRPSGPVFRLPERSTTRIPPSLEYGPPLDNPANKVNASNNITNNVQFDIRSDALKEDIKELTNTTQKSFRTLEYNITQENSNNSEETKHLGEFDADRSELQLNYGIPENSKDQKQIDLTYGAPEPDSIQNNTETPRNSRKEKEFNISNAKVPQFFIKTTTSYGVPQGNTNSAGDYFAVNYLPQDTLSVPPNAPAVTYGPPEDISTTTVESLDQTTIQPSVPENLENEDVNISYSKEQISNGVPENVKEDLKNGEKENGVYYIYHPNGILQKITYSTKENNANMGYSAQLRYENVEPINGPLYTYNPTTYVLERIN